MAKKNKSKFLSFRLNILFLLTFMLFAALIFRLGFLQIVQGEELREKSERQNVRKVSVESPRGWMMDRNGEVLVQNVPVFTVTYTESHSQTEEERKRIAEHLGGIIDMDPEDVLHEMSRASSPFSPTRIKQDLTFEQISMVEESAESLPGVDIIIDPKRQYNYDRLFSNFLGKVGPIQADQLQTYLANGYRMNEWVGTSYLELQYEEQLRGTEGTIEVAVDSQLRPIDDPITTQGQRGNDLVLTIDLKLQQKIEEVVARTIEENELVTEAYFVAMDPNTGEILGMTNDVRTIGAGRTSYAPGSVIKMATTLMGLHEGIVTPQTRINDVPIQIGNLTKRSWRNLGSVDALRALQRSSNIYMFEIGLALNSRLSTRQEAFDRAFYYFSQFGLGVKTGIDLPEEYDGYKSDSTLLGLLADFMIGQYHNYTPLQLAQYVSTIANGGNRLQPYLVKEIRRDVSNEEDGLGQIIMERKPNILNRIEMSEEHIRLVQRGMELVTEGDGTGASIFGSFPIKVAAKTGTAQTVEADGSFGNNHVTLVGYAPADDPQIAFAAVVPKSQVTQSQGQISFAQVITREILEEFFGLNDEDTDDSEDEADATNNEDENDEEE
ncbi:peptidoglycan D,D-transpeptidase FtsI family protein [Bacillus horti]|uniref:serine-type D-Ala-D-Ala carboxypeptidase n=1 Tax=Caldalkalibacillus horti TaxID=77523 RepID=A0ABT9W4D0_9BACI|nr:penicillin-binding protein 2 [Bacillus horti]MDQ0168091.1 cell division protein FtsI/penicillin-binding protein 2 [Bacillus horti]